MSGKQSYYSGNPDHADKSRRYLTNRRELYRLLVEGHIHVFSIDQRAEWLGDATLGGHGRIKILCDSKRVYADNMGLYTLA